jgi:hypothetical protein
MRTLAELEGIRLGDMTPDERRLVIASAVAKLKAELESPAFRKAMGQVPEPPSKP